VQRSKTSCVHNHMRRIQEDQFAALLASPEREGYVLYTYWFISQKLHGRHTTHECCTYQDKLSSIAFVSSTLEDLSFSDCDICGDYKGKCKVSWVLNLLKQSAAGVKKTWRGIRLPHAQPRDAGIESATGCVHTRILSALCVSSKHDNDKPTSDSSWSHIYKVSDNH
jgi:hypothetical protein